MVCRVVLVLRLVPGACWLGFVLAPSSQSPNQPLALHVCAGVSLSVTVLGVQVFTALLTSASPPLVSPVSLSTLQSAGCVSSGGDTA